MLAADHPPYLFFRPREHTSVFVIPGCQATPGRAHFFLWWGSFLTCRIAVVGTSLVGVPVCPLAAFSRLLSTIFSMDDSNSSRRTIFAGGSDLCSGGCLSPDPCWSPGDAITLLSTESSGKNSLTSTPRKLSPCVQNTALRMR